MSPLTLKPNEAGLGSYPQTTLAMATKTVIEWRAMVRNGIDPVAHRRAEKLKVKTNGKTLRDVLDLYAEEFKAHAGAREGVKLIERHAAALLTRPANDDIAPVEVKAALAGVIAAYPKTAARTRAALSALFEYAIANDYRTARDPAAKAIFRKLMPPPPKSEPYRMMPPADVPKLFATLTAMGSTSSLALAYLILVAGRTAEVIGLHTSEIDLDKRLVVIPGSRMKAAVEHRYPISDPALAILTEMRARHGCRRLRVSGEARRPLVEPAARNPAAPKARRAVLGAWVPCIVQQLGSCGNRSSARADRTGAGAHRRARQRGGKILQQVGCS